MNEKNLSVYGFFFTMEVYKENYYETGQIFKGFPADQAADRGQ